MTSFLSNLPRSNQKKIFRRSLLMALVQNLLLKNNNEWSIPNYVTTSMKKCKHLTSFWASRENNFHNLFLSKVIQKLEGRSLISSLNLSRGSIAKSLKVMSIFSSWTWKIQFLLKRAQANLHWRNHQWKKIGKIFRQLRRCKTLNSQAQSKVTHWNCLISALAQWKALSRWILKKKTGKASRENKKKRLKMMKIWEWNHQRKMERKLILNTSKWHQFKILQPTMTLVAAAAATHLWNHAQSHHWREWRHLSNRKTWKIRKISKLLTRSHQRGSLL